MSLLADQTAIVSGASGGLGRAIALRLAHSGVRTVLVARREPELVETADSIRSVGADVAMVVGDVTKPDVRDDTLDLAARRFGGLDLLVNNAGVSAVGRFHESDPIRLRQVMEVNFFAAVEFVRHAIPLLAESGRGCVANVGSILAWRGVPRNAGYCASKFALRGWSEGIRPELARLGIHVLHASPATIDTPFFDHLIEDRGVPWRRRRGYPPELVADRIVRGVVRRRREVSIGWSDWAFVRAARFTPGWMERLLRRYG